MQDIILFHYPMSPFSEKMRAMLGYAGLPWQSVVVKEMPPRPALSILAGGYRKVPVAQSGADVFCDSRAIADEIVRRSGKKELSLEGQPQEVIDFVKTADLDIFLACVIAASDGRLLRKLIRETSLLNTFRFLKDRIAMGKKSRVKAVRGPKAKAKVIAHIGTMESMLTGDFLFGDSPCIADFSAYHGLWFACDLAGKPWLGDYPKVSEWMARMKAFGHGESREISADQALDIARDATPETIEPACEDELSGRNVEVAPDDYGREPVTGTLVFADDKKVIVARSHNRVGQVHVHFPQQGFAIRPA